MFLLIKRGSKKRFHKCFQIGHNSTGCRNTLQQLSHLIIQHHQLLMVHQPQLLNFQQIQQLLFSLFIQM
ncbi:hypothetical protein ERO13_A12G069399v2 [Gossypium hirsutum]|uniref:Uncharacterized protein n=1 Tax=Gossypium barbadense TaxID=3634 RepID=A0A5J5TD67_GOSBA|nr:hypothetical protein ES319_A12G078000v1 [Gossypium barbadense]KAG4169284.1 hypothetical protein ERO13_A12G069399v2 [Gossypium hirsutum]